MHRLFSPPRVAMIAALLVVAGLASANPPETLWSARRVASESIDYSANGRFYAVGGGQYGGHGQNRVTIRRAADDSIYRTITVGSDARSVALNSDGSRLFVGTNDGVEAWDVLSGRRLWAQDSGNIYSIDVSPDGQRVAHSRSNDGALIRNAATGALITQYDDTYYHYAVAYSANGQRLGVAGFQGRVSVFSTADGSLVRTMTRNTNDIWGIAWAPGSTTTLYTASNDDTAQVWNVGTGGVQVFSGHTGDVRRVAPSFDGTRLVTASADGTIRVWNTTNRSLIHTFASSRDYGVTALAASPNQMFAISGTEYSALQKWDIAAGAEALLMVEPQEEIYALAFRPDGSQLFAAGGYQNLGARVYDPRNGRTLSVAPYNNDVWEAQYSPDGTWYALARYGGDVEIRSASTHAQITTITPNNGGHVYGVAISPDGALLAVASQYDPEIQLWRTADWGFEKGLNVDSDPRRLAFSPNNQFLAAGLVDGTGRLWNLTNDNVTTLSGHSDDVWEVEFSPDAQYLLTGAYDNSIRLYSGTSGAFIQSFSGHSGDVTGLAWMPDSNAFASTSRDGTVLVWDLNGAVLHTVVADEGRALTGLAMSPDAKWLAVGSHSNVQMIANPLARATVSIALFNPTSRAMGYWTTRAGSITGWRNVGTLGAAWRPQAFGNFARFGRDQIVQFNATTGQSGAWTWSGSAVTGWLTLPRVAAGWTLVATGDVNGDGQEDVVVQRTSDGILGAYLMDGSTQLGWFRLPTPAAGWTLVDVADANGDASQDLILYNASTRRLAAWTMRGGQVVGWQTLLTTTPSGWEYKGLADFDADGQPDLLIYNSTTRRLGAYLLDTGVVVGWRSLNLVGAGWDVLGVGNL